MSCASNTNNGWPSNKEASRALRGSLWTVSSDVEKAIPKSNTKSSGVQGHQAMMRFENRRQREDETIDKFLDNLERLRRRSQPDESNKRMNLAVASKFTDGVKNDELRTMLATHYTQLSTNAPTQVKRMSFSEASIGIWILQEQLWQFQQRTSKPSKQLV